MENKHYIGFIIILFIFLGFFAMASMSTTKENTVLKKESELYKTILLADNRLSEISIDRQMADKYHNLAQLAYENSNDKEVESNCKIAREYYLNEGQGYREIKAELNSKNLADKLIDIYIDNLDASIEITNNMYEACEHFESAARYYDNDNYDMGGKEIGMMNEKIRAHDTAVEKYNNLLEDFKIELRKRLE